MPFLLLNFIGVGRRTRMTFMRGAKRMFDGLLVRWLLVAGSVFLLVFGACALDES